MISFLEYISRPSLPPQPLRPQIPTTRSLSRTHAYKYSRMGVLYACDIDIFINPTTNEFGCDLSVLLFSFTYLFVSLKGSSRFTPLEQFSSYPDQLNLIFFKPFAKRTSPLPTNLISMAHYHIRCQWLAGWLTILILFPGRHCCTCLTLRNSPFVVV